MKDLIITNSNSPRSHGKLEHMIPVNDIGLVDGVIIALLFFLLGSIPFILISL